MDNFIANIKNKLMLPSNETKKDEMPRHTPLIPLPDIDNMTATVMPSHQSEPKQDVSQIQNEPHDSSTSKTPSKSSFSVLLKPFSSEKKTEEEKPDSPAHVPNPIEDDIFIYYD